MGNQEPVEDVAEVLVGVQRLIRRRLRRDLAGPRLRGAQVELLRLVLAQPGIGVSGAARELHLAGNSVSTLVNQLVSVGLLTREPDPQDRRAVRLTVTREAVTRLGDWDARRSALVREQVAGLAPEDQAAIAAALPSLRRLAAGLHADLEAP
ncbi:MarR family winged helix-turn-helix transcriptional regulator [Streptacidiphilus sp. EB129]|uniref:MarR family winged helix-turn-helix transcriptional regulator n=1 Tax=Streptacidiphilus sp. EB129 TaxID=3156262 RepID=UPI003513EA22